MPAINHLYAVVKGGYDDTQLLSEGWQMGLRLLPTLNAHDLIGTPPNEFEAASASITTSSTNWDATSNFLCEGGITDLDPGDYACTYGEAVKALFETVAVGFSDDVNVSEVTIYPIGTDGKVISLETGPAKAVATPKALLDGTATGTQLPIQCSVVVSLRSDNTTRRGRGRMYPPPVTHSSLEATTGFIPSSARANYATGFKAFLEAVAIGSGGSPPIVRPIVIGAPWTTYYTVTSVKVGSQVDTQRRRRNQIEETYSSAAISY